MNTQTPYSTYRIIILAMISLQSIGDVQAAPQRHVVENQQIKMVIIPRTAQQMAAFYEGREFPVNAIQATRDACFFTVGIRNKTKQIIWLDTQQWTFTTKTGSTALISRAKWTQRWKKLALEQRFQSTFRWTLLPNQLDFQPDEREGGNITLPRTDMPFTLSARFETGADKKGKPLTIMFKGLKCARDTTP